MQKVRLFLARSWAGPCFRPIYGAEYDEREPRPSQRLEVEVLERSASWVFTVAGEAVYRDGEHALRLRPGTVFVHESPETGVIHHPPKGGRWHHLWISVSGHESINFVRYVTRHYGRLQTLPSGASCVRLARQLLALAEAQSERDAKFWSVKTHEWLNAWWREVETHSVPLSTVLQSPHEARRVALAAVSLKRMAQELGYSRSHLGRRLKRMWDGQAPGRILRKVRLDEAARLLNETELTIADVAMKVGYARSSSFVTAFKARFGKPPLKYRHERGSGPVLP